MENYKELRTALTEIRDNYGFNKYDTEFAKSLIKKPVWSYSMANSIHKMLSKYNNHLSFLGIEYKNLLKPTGEEKQIEPKKEIIESKIEIKKNKSVSENFNKIDNVLYKFQKEDLSKIDTFNGKALLALPMGAGKTLISIAYMTKYPELRPAIIIPPASVKIQWQKEINKWLPGERIKIVEGRSDYFDGNDNNIIIINYDLLAWYWELLEDLNPKLVIADEAHRLRGNSSQRSQCTKKLTRKVSNLLFLTGTPLYHRPIDLFPMLKMMGLKASYYDFGIRYCSEENDINNQFKGASNIQELNSLLTKNFMIRRSEQEIEKDLPPENNIIIPIKIDNRKEYDLAETDLREYLRQYEGVDTKRLSGNSEILMKLGKLRSLAAEGKMKMIKDWLSDFIETGGKITTFSYNHKIMDYIYDNFKDITVNHNGKLSAKKKDKVKEEFINDNKIKIFNGQIHASGEGVDGLQKVCHNLLFTQLDWGPQSHKQAAKRLKRNGINKDFKKVNVFWAIGVNTIDEKMAEVIDKKRRIIDATIDNTVPESESMISELINFYRKK